PDINGTIDSQGYNLVQNPAGVPTLISSDLRRVDPGLGSLANNGGPTQTHLLPIGSPAIDAGPPGGCVDAFGAPLTTDQRGRTRPSDGNGDGSTICDIGAVERTPGLLQFSAPTYSASEIGPSAPITIARTGGSDGIVSATVTLTDGTASAPA